MACERLKEEIVPTGEHKGEPMRKNGDRYVIINNNNNNGQSQKL